MAGGAQSPHNPAAQSAIANAAQSAQNLGSGQPSPMAGLGFTQPAPGVPQASLGQLFPNLPQSVQNTMAQLNSQLPPQSQAASMLANDPWLMSNQIAAQKAAGNPAYQNVNVQTGWEPARGQPMSGGDAQFRYGDAPQGPPLPPPQGHPAARQGGGGPPQAKAGK